MKKYISYFLRKTGLIFFVDKIWYQINRIKNKKQNRLFLKNNPSVMLPPDYLIFESFKINYKNYFNDSKDSARKLISEFSQYIDFNNEINILDWGCGPGRIIRHFPSLLDKGFFYGTDYNSESIQWCQKNIENVNFSSNKVSPPLHFENDFFDIIYGISIFTHLSEENHYKWRDELMRVLKPEGILYITTHGNNYIQKLLPNEVTIFNEGKVVERGNVKEGHRTYTAFQPSVFMRKLFKDFDIIIHKEVIQTSKWVPQDIWIIRKKR